jgi:hypothetical protein
MKTDVKIISFEELIGKYAEEWCNLFCNCFKVKITEAQYILKTKYTLNDGYVALLFVDLKLVASYAVIRNSNEAAVGLSVDTMADGSVMGATLKLTVVLYPYLTSKGIEFLLGYPNEHILKMRLKRLGWESLRLEDIYFGKIKSYQKSELTFRLIRPPRRYFQQGPLGFFLTICDFFNVGFGFQDEIAAPLRFKISQKHLCVKRLSNKRDLLVTSGIYGIDVP